ncbi:MAG: hypothetical protein CVV64_02765 [Candidatus Wallbacteria bacterium HGW-Wallbacteria-1]|jgi:HSP20 family molecular chaperone IbpA|uniref:SHSP domain-containing protein n=1 Tax=Candidatus Wallbacteria bacterium HGW-Wallbacteria-1 TaxID=2013854 RepID=A0A2N1PTH0_9BACT|nr:MAG: hypothetical protein CVV64_02765 [Candidatus Wallbacteria bacterium HGW-Wallbacteria-1]
MLQEKKRHSKFDQKSLIVIGVILALFLGTVFLFFERSAAARNEKPAVQSVSDTEILVGKIEKVLNATDQAAEHRIKSAMELIRDHKSKQLKSEKSESPLTNDPLDDSLIDDFSLFASPFSMNTWNSFREMNQMRSDMNRLFDSAFTRLKDKRLRFWSDMDTGWSPGGDFKSLDNAYVYHFAVPGVEKNNITVTVQNGELVVEGNSESVSEEVGADDSTAREVFRGHFSRVISLPEDADTAGVIDSSLENGVLTVKISKVRDKSDKVKRKIEIK